MDLQVKLETQHNHRCSILWRLSVLKNTNNYDVVYAKLSLSGRRVAPQATSSFESFAFLSFQSFRKTRNLRINWISSETFLGGSFLVPISSGKNTKRKKLLVVYSSSCHDKCLGVLFSCCNPKFASWCSLFSYRSWFFCCGIVL